MSSSASTSTPSSSCLPEKREPCLGDEVCDPFATSGSSFDWADDVEQELYSDPDSRDTDVSRADSRANTLSIDRFFASDIRTFGEGGSSLSAMAEDDEDEDEEDDAGSSATGSLVDRIFANGTAPTRYRVASIPSLGAIEEDDESELGDDDDDDDEADRPLTSSPSSRSDESASAVSSIADSEHFDSLRLSVASISTLDEDARREDDPDFGWVWIEIEDGEAVEPPTVPLARSCEAREWRWLQVLRKFFAL